MYTFDKYSWHPQSWNQPNKLNDALEAWGVTDKKIKEVHAIGLADEFDNAEFKWTVRGQLMKAGVPVSVIDKKQYQWIDRFRVQCMVNLYEPVVFVLEDNTTIEMKLNSSGELSASVNKIGKDVIDGLNKSNFNSNILFSKIKGCKIKSVQTIHRVATSNLNSEQAYKEMRKTVAWEFTSDGDYGFCFSHENGGRYIFSMTDQHWSAIDIGDKTATVSYKTVSRACKNIKQIPIYDGIRGGGTFSIFSMRRNLNKEFGTEDFEGHEGCLISIDEMHISNFLYYFLEKYFDTDYPYGNLRAEFCFEGFEWNLEHNIYTYETTAKMLSEIEQCVLLLKDDYENEALIPIKKQFSVYDFMPDFKNKYVKIGKNAGEKIIHDNINIAIDFYTRFICNMRKMMKEAEDDNLISFFGP